MSDLLRERFEAWTESETARQSMMAVVARGQARISLLRERGEYVDRFVQTAWLAWQAALAAADEEKK